MLTKLDQSIRRLQRPFVAFLNNKSNIFAGEQNSHSHLSSRKFAFYALKLTENFLERHSSIVFSTKHGQSARQNSKHKIIGWPSTAILIRWWSTWLCWNPVIFIRTSVNLWIINFLKQYWQRMEYKCAESGTASAKVSRVSPPMSSFPMFFNNISLLASFIYQKIP